MNKINWQNTIISPCETFHLFNNTPFYLSRFNKVMKYHAPGLAAVKDSSGAYHIDIHGLPKYTNRFLETYGFYETVAAVRDTTGWFHINSNGEELYNERYLWCGNFQESLCVVMDKNYKYFHIDFYGKKNYKEVYNYVGDFKDGIAVICNQDGLHTHIDKRGKFIHKNWFLGLDIFHKGAARAKDEKGWYHINKLGQSLYQERYIRIEPFYNGVAHVEDFSGELLTIDINGKKIIELKPPSQKIWQKISDKMVGFWQTETLCVATKLKVLEGLPGTTKEIGKKITVPHKHLEKLLRALWELDFIKNESGYWQLTENGKNIIPHKDNFLSSAAIMWSDVNRIAWKNLINIIKGKDKKNTLFKINASNKKRKIYHHAIDGYAMKDFSFLLSFINWKKHKKIIGVGRSAKILIEKVLIKYQHLEGLLLGENYIFKPISIHSSIKSRYHLKEHILYNPWPKMADIILFPRVLHYWTDHLVISILQKAYNALLFNGEIYLLEMFIDENNPKGALLDLNILAESGGKLRTFNQWKNLLKQSSLFIFQHLNITNSMNLLVLKKEEERYDNGIKKKHF
ncbi:MAG: methyltransferase (plasmid) [Arsenophonus sp.]|nr:MAG: methyltransferase [Arsenophonus sp.]